VKEHRPGPVHPVQSPACCATFCLTGGRSCIGGLMAMVGLLDAGRVLLIRPIFDRVLNPGSQEKTIQLFKLPGSGRFSQSRAVGSVALSQSMDGGGVCAGGGDGAEGIFDYIGTYLVNYAVRDDHRSARRFV